MDNRKEFSKLVDLATYGKSDKMGRYIEYDYSHKVFTYLEKINYQEDIDEFNKKLLPILVVKMNHENLSILLDNPKIDINYLYKYRHKILLNRRGDMTCLLIHIIGEPNKLSILLQKGLNINKRFILYETRTHHYEKSNIVEYIKNLLEYKSSFKKAIFAINVLMKSGYSKKDIGIADNELSEEINEKYHYYKSITDNLFYIIDTPNIKPAKR